MKPALNVGQVLDVPTGKMFDFGKPLPNVDMAPEHYIDYHPEETQRQINQMLAISQKGRGQFDGKAWLENLKASIAEGPPQTIITIDSYSPMT